MRRILVIAGVMLLSSAGLAQTATPTRVPVGAQTRAKPMPMSDAALDKVTAGTVSAGVSDGVVKFQGQTPTPNGLVSSSGSLALQGSSITNTTTGTLSISGNAQQNLSSLVNINAVNSKINVLMNFNININSTVGTLTQSNLKGIH
ncbi:hypothetical protein [Edaphobacter aggregans]|uniref:hypothetical protein n=1 Tax=Edaphobacter aggregans TaxID=570835 RepID=UPI000557230B|nr:hypothetical protein [Edaphobacter aggregans]